MAKRAQEKPVQPTVTVAARDAMAPTFHSLYGQFQPDWNLLAHVREGTGGFKDGTFLIAHPREWQDYTAENPTKPTKKLIARRNLACYENFASTIIEAKKSSLFREVPSRQVGPKGETEATNSGPSDLEQWWTDVDGSGTAVDDFFQYAWDLGATFGHVWLYMDRPKGAAGATAADARIPFLRVYTPIDLIDWLCDDRGQITSVLFQEPVPRATFQDPAAQTKRRLRLVTNQYWALYDENGQLAEGGPTDGRHEMGTLPVVPLFAQRRSLYRQIGQSVLGDPKLYQDLYNLTSEVRELLRNQTFSFINIPLGTGDAAMTVEQAAAMLGGQIGAMNVIFSGAAAQILAGEAENVTVYHEEFNRRLRTIYRLAGISWESDSKDAEAQGSLKLKREDMNTRLASYADELEKVDYAIAKLWYRAMFGADAGVRRYDEAQVRLRYPDTFDLTPFDAVLEQAQAAMSLGFPALVLKELRKALIAKFLPDLDPEKLKALQDAIDSAADDLTPDERLKARIDATSQSIRREART